MATLTGAMVLAMGDIYAGVYANDDAWRDQVVDAANAAATTSGRCRCTAATAGT